MDFETATKDAVRIESSREDAFHIETDKDGSRYGTFTVDYGDIIYDGTRCELVIVSDELCTIPEAHYYWSVRLPRDYPREGMWQMFAQWHDQPDEEHGVTWDTKPPTFPPISLRCSKQRIYIQINRPNVDRWWVGQHFDMPLGEWVNFHFHIKWSMDSDGFVEAWMNDTPLTPFNGTDYKLYAPLIYNSTGNYLKLGNYRNKEIRGTTTVHIDNIRITN